MRIFSRKRRKRGNFTLLYSVQPETTSSADENLLPALEARVRQARKGDRAAFDWLAMRFRPLLFTVAFLRTGDSGEAEDLVQDALTQAWRRLPTLKDAAAFPAWVRAILVQGCNTWFRRGKGARIATRPLDEALLLAGDGTATPLARLLRRERERELHQALLTLPEANRIALLLHIWGGYTTAEIAALTGVLPSTVEGRIFRAKRQLRRRLKDEGAGLLQEPRRAWTDNAQTKDNPMTVSSPSVIAPISSDLPLQCVLFNERFSRLIDSGVSLVRALQALEEMPPPYGPAIADIARLVQAGETLSGAMRNYPALFSAFSLGLVRAGEVGGILEEALQRVRQVTGHEWALARRRPVSETPFYLTLPSGLPLPSDWADLSEYQRLLTLALFCYALSMLLASGVPMLQALATVGELLPAAQRTLMEEAREKVRAATPLHEALEGLGIFPAFVQAFLEVGFVSGTLDSTLYLAAETIEQELNCRFTEGA